MPRAEGEVRPAAREVIVTEEEEDMEVAVDARRADRRGESMVRVRVDITIEEQGKIEANFGEGPVE
jgi:hypothetical protein